MTISIAWHRKFAGVDEIICASDSRLSAGYRWDCAQKIFPIEGPNFCVSFAGETDFAFPCIFQFKTMVQNYQKFADGAAPIAQMTKDFLAILNQMVELVDDKLFADFTKTQFLISGFDFGTGEPYLKKIAYDKQLKKYQRHPGGGLKVGNVGASVSFIGDEYEDYFRTLARILKKDGTEVNYQPLEAFRQVLKSQKPLSYIGGSLQVVKVYRHRNYLPYAVRETEGQPIHLFGRPLLEYERTRYPIISLDRLVNGELVDYPLGAPQRELGKPKKL